ncbi:hypothetical protein OHB12_06035 [Nocardia sp. NBC_01730]|uniref:hypothetical protein n=1 Tax=Nocardia sp. NBC_01730 TaxID=2975998 RepID=UPI002E0EF869|nr:hypothetical protein OHB12_06035 [Nocardia sp. NBC_01730]
MKPPSTLRHIHIEFNSLKLDFTASAELAQNVADVLAQGFPGFVVTIDDDIPPDPPPRPCTDPLD